MVSPFLSLGAGLVGGIPQGVATAQQLSYNQQSMQYMRQQQSIQAISAFSSALRIADPNARKTALTNLMPGLGMDPNSDTGQTFLKDQMKYTDDTLAQMSQSLKDAGIQGIDSKMIGQMYQNDPSSFYNWVFQLSQYRQAQNILQDTGGGTQPVAPAPAPAGTQQAGGGMGTSGQTAAGTAPPPTSQGTAPAVVAPAVTQQPAVQQTQQTSAQQTNAQGQPINAQKTDAQGNAIAPPLTTNAQGNIDPTPASANGYAVVPGKGIAINNVSVGGNPLFWNPNNDPYVQKLNAKYAQLEMLPGDYGPKAANIVKDQRDLYIKGKLDTIQHIIDYTRLGIEQGTLDVRRGQLQVSQALAANQILGPTSDIGRVSHDIALGNLDPATVVANENIIRQKAGLPPLAIPAPAAGGGTAAGGVGAGVQFPPGAVAQITGEPPAGSTPISNEALLNALHIEKGQTAYMSPDGKQILIRTPSATAVPPADVGELQQKRSRALQTLQQVNQVATEYNQDPSKFGLSGYVKGEVQSFLQRGMDAANLVPLAGEFAKQYAKGIIPDNYFDPKLPGYEYQEHVWAMALAGMMYQGTGAMGGFAETLNHAEEMVHIIGPDIDSRTAGVHLQQLQDTLKSTIDSYDKMINMQGAPPASATQVNTQQTAPALTTTQQPTQQQTQQAATQQPQTPAAQTKAQLTNNGKVALAPGYYMFNGEVWHFKGGADIPANWEPPAVKAK